MKAYLLLADGTVYEGKSCGAEGKQKGEVVFNTSLTGYRKLLTDPSNRGLIIVATYPLMGNYGLNDQEVESDEIQAAGLVMRECVDLPNHWQSKGRLRDYLKEKGTVALEGIDTRALTRRLRQKGAMAGVLVTGERSQEELKALAEEARAEGEASRNLVAEVSVGEARILPPLREAESGSFLRLAVVDLGAGYGLINSLRSRGCEVALVPWNFSSSQVLDLQPAGVVVAGGPGNPAVLDEVVETVRQLIGKGVPLLGLGLGHLAAGLALGGKSQRMAFGHRGASYPVKDLEADRFYITKQNHGYVLDESSLAQSEATVVLRNLNDQSIEGLVDRRRRVFTLQYFPSNWEDKENMEYPLARFWELIA